MHPLFHLDDADALLASKYFGNATLEAIRAWQRSIALGRRTAAAEPRSLQRAACGASRLAAAPRKFTVSRTATAL